VAHIATIALRAVRPMVAKLPLVAASAACAASMQRRSMSDPV
jgi:hypothetical protein